MAIIRNMEPLSLEKEAKHTEVDSTYTIVESKGERFLQIDTYGSKQRQIEGKKSQSIRLSQEAIVQLLEIIKAHKLG